MSRVAISVVLAASLASAQIVALSADLSGATTAQTYPILSCVGSSHGSTTLREDWRRHLNATRQAFPAQQVRFHGVLDDDMSTLLFGDANMFNVFSTFDFLVSIGMKPYIELSFMPEQLATDPTLTVFHYQGGISPPANWTKWTTFVQQFTSELVTRYGLAEVATWKFEIWNEPNCGFYYQANCCGPTDCGNQTAYFELYAATAGAVKAVDASLQVGGPSTAQLSWLPAFLAAAAASGTPVDFVSSHLYPTDPAVALDRDGFSVAVAAAASVAAAAGKPFVLSEFNSGLGLPNGQDDEYASAFAVHQHLAHQGVPNLQTLSWWTFSDIFEEGGFDSTPWNGKFGMQTIYQVPKPVYRAMTMIGALPPKTVPVTVTAGAKASAGGSGQAVVARHTSISVGTVDATVAVDADSTPGVVAVYALLANFNTPGQTLTPQSVTLTFTGAPGGGAFPANATVSLVDATHASALPVWVAQGRPQYPSPAQTALQLEASQVVPVSVPLVPEGAGAASVTLTLQPQAVALITFEVPA